MRQSLSTTLPSPPSEMEAQHYYDGLHSAPRLVARSSTTPWVPAGPDEGKELRPGGGTREFRDAWADNLPRKIIALLDSMQVKWSSLDVVRIGMEEEWCPPTILWIGVMPESLSADRGVRVAFHCRRLLEKSDITDIEVEIQESVVTRWGGLSGLPSDSLDDKPKGKRGKKGRRGAKRRGLI